MTEETNIEKIAKEMAEHFYASQTIYPQGETTGTSTKTSGEEVKIYLHSPYDATIESITWND